MLERKSSEISSQETEVKNIAACRSVDAHDALSLGYLDGARIVFEPDPLAEVFPLLVLDCKSCAGPRTCFHCDLVGRLFLVYAQSHWTSLSLSPFKVRRLLPIRKRDPYPCHVLRCAFKGSVPNLYLDYFDGLILAHFL